MSNKETVFSPDRAYRYTLWRQWSGSMSDDLLLGRGPFNDRYCMFICLNPSTADETNDDPTMRRCIGFAKRWGMGAMIVTNLFALRATDPKVMLQHPEPIGEYNDHYIISSAIGAEFVIAAWGNHGLHMRRYAQVCEIMQRFACPMYCLGVTGKAQPKHPLYLRAEAPRLSYGTCFRCSSPEVGGICQNYGCETPRMAIV
jgi:hypothetical protein